MSSAAISDYHFSGCSNDYESLLNNCSSSSSTASSPNDANERHTEKRAKSNTVINKIRRFARSQSQIRHGSRGHDYINSENLVSKTKDLYRDVKRRFSSFNTNSLESSDKRSSSTTCKSVLPSARTSSNLKANCESDSRSTLTCETLQSTTVSRLRRYASDESLPTSESGCGSSVKTSSFSTDSNRSSICTVNDFSNEYSVFKGPFIGQGIALADCTPCPYDKDALVFKKGDLVNIIAKNDSGTWIGMANGKIGHFKFINVEEISSLSNGMRPTYSSFCSASSTTLTSSNGAIEGDKGSNVNNTLDVSEGVSLTTGSSASSTTTINNFSSSSAFLSNHYEDIIRNLLSSVNIYLDNSLKGLFKLIGLDGYDYLTKLREKGFSSLGSLMNITDPSILEIVGITCPDHQQTILSIASIVRKLAHSIPDNQTQSKAIEINRLETNLASMSVDADRPMAQSAPTTPAFESFQKTLSFVLNTSSNGKEKQSSSSQEPNNFDESVKCNTSSGPLKEVKNYATTIAVPSNDGNPSSALRLRKKRDRRSSETSDNIKRAASGNDILDDDLYSKCRFSSFDHRKSLDTNALVKKLEHGYETRTSHYGDISSNKMLSSSKSVFDLKYNENANLEETNVHGGHFTKKRLKKLLNPSDRKAISTISFEDRRLGVTSRPLSTALLDTLSNMLTEETIDLTTEPYSDASGFCGIPPALVQRYAEELETDIYDIAETLDYIRLCSLLNKAGRQGIPNDFLADSCNVPGTDLANYENIHNWLLSLGLPMYETKLLDNGFKSLWDMMSLREDDLINCGIINKRHLRSLTTAISALSVNQHKIGKA